MLTLLNVLLVAALLMLVLMVAACASISIHSTEDRELNAFSMYRQTLPVAPSSRAAGTTQTHFDGRRVGHRARSAEGAQYRSQVHDGSATRLKQRIKQSM